MILFADYHTHTKYSHGSGTVLENTAAAAKVGLEQIAISDHGPSHMLGIGIANIGILDIIAAQAQEAMGIYQQVQVLLGIESNVTSIAGDIDITPEYREKVDILQVGLHLMVRPEQWSDGLKRTGLHFLRSLTPGLRRKSRLANTEAIVNAVYRNKIDVITHPGHRFNIDTKELARACAKRGTAFEINASHENMTVETISIAATEGVQFVIGSDAHKPERVGDFASGIAIAKAAGLTVAQILNAR